MGKHVTDVGLEKTAGEHEIKKHAATIHCSNTLSLLQRKITNALLYHAYKELMSKEEHEISIKHLCKLIAYHGNNHAAIKEALKGLLSTVIEWNLVNDTTGLEDWTASSILASVSLQGPICYFAYSPRMKQLLHSPSMFGKINLLVQSRFKSSYGLALYENCIRYRGLPYTKWFELELFRKLMGVPPDKYPVFRDFKRRVLDKSIEEVNTYSELIVDADVQREGRQVTKIRFSLKEREKKTRIGGANAKADALLEDQQEGESMLSVLRSKLINQFGLSDEQTRQILRDYSHDFIADKITLIESSRNYQRGNVHNIAGYFLSALKNNYQAPKPVKEIVIRNKKAEKKQEEDSKQIARWIAKIKEDYLTYKETLIDSNILDMPAKERAVFIEKFYQHAADSIQIVLTLQRKKYSRKTVINSPQIKALLRQFALRELQGIQQQLLPIEKFVEKLPEKQQKAWQSQHEKNVEIISEEVVD